MSWLPLLRGARRTGAVLVVLAAAGVLTGCGSTGATGASTPTPGVSVPTSATSTSVTGASVAVTVTDTASSADPAVTVSGSASGEVTTSAVNGAAPPTSGCPRVSSAQVSTALGVPVSDATTGGVSHGVLPVMVTCTFDTPDHGKGLAVVEYATATDLAPFLNGGEPVTGVGDQASWLPEGTLYVRKGAHGFGLAASGFDVTDPAVTKNLEASLIQLANATLPAF